MYVCVDRTFILFLFLGLSFPSHRANHRKIHKVVKLPTFLFPLSFSNHLSLLFTLYPRFSYTASTSTWATTSVCLVVFQPTTRLLMSMVFACRLLCSRRLESLGICLIATTEQWWMNSYTQVIRQMDHRCKNPWPSGMRPHCPQGREL